MLVLLEGSLLGAVRPVPFMIVTLVESALLDLLVASMGEECMIFKGADGSEGCDPCDSVVFSAGGGSADTGPVPPVSTGIVGGRLCDGRGCVTIGLGGGGGIIEGICDMNVG